MGLLSVDDRASRRVLPLCGGSNHGLDEWGTSVVICFVIDSSHGQNCNDCARQNRNTVVTFGCDVEVETQFCKDVCIAMCEKMCHVRQDTDVHKRTVARTDSASHTIFV